MIYSDYVAIVLEQLTVDAGRRGLEDFRAQQIRNSVVDLQRFIRGYRKGHTTTYTEADVTQVGCAARGILPDQAVPEAFWIQSTAAVTHPPCDVAAPVRNRLDIWPWDNRDHLSYAACDRRLYAYTLSPYSRSFIVHPALNDETELLLVWEGIKRDFADGDAVPWPEDASEASAAYVKWQINLQVDKNIPLAREYQGLYNTKRLALYRDFQERLDAEKPDEEQTTDTPPVPPPGTGGQITITQLEGVTSNALAAIATAGLSLPYLVEAYIGGNLQRWLLTESTDATDIPGGKLRPNDYDAAAPRGWTQLS